MKRFLLRGLSCLRTLFLLYCKILSELLSILHKNLKISSQHSKMNNKKIKTNEKTFGDIYLSSSSKRQAENRQQQPRPVITKNTKAQTDFDISAMNWFATDSLLAESIRFNEYLYRTCYMLTNKSGLKNVALLETAQNYDEFKKLAEKRIELLVGEKEKEKEKERLMAFNEKSFDFYVDQFTKVQNGLEKYISFREGQVSSLITVLEVVLEDDNSMIGHGVKKLMERFIKEVNNSLETRKADKDLSAILEKFEIEKENVEVKIAKTNVVELDGKVDGLSIEEDTLE